MPDNASEIRPGVFRPDWTAITKPAARQALSGRIAARAGLVDKWSHQLDVEQDLLWRTTLQLYADRGQAPQIADLAAETGLAPDKITALLRELQARDLVGVDSQSGRVRLAYPFTEASTEHEVELNGRRLRALCAIDALGIGAMYGADTTIRSRCDHCGKVVRVAVTGGGRVVEGLDPIGTVVWYDFAYEGNAAISCCPSIVFFCSDLHLEQWKAAPTPRAGVRLTIDEALEVGRAIFGPVLARGSAGKH